MNRYLINISYIGTAFRGMQKTINKADPASVDVNSIQGVLEIALCKLRPVNTVQVVLSSRTDAGVHALQNSVHVDLEHPHGEVYPTDAVTSLLNRHFSRTARQIRIISTIHVPNTFHCRYSAKGRSYMYRIAVAKHHLFSKNSDKKLSLKSFIPIEEYDRCLFIQKDQFDIETFKDAAQLFVGVHDFRTFMNFNKRDSKQYRPNFGVRIIDSFDVKSGRACISGTSAKYAESFYDYWDIIITGKSFMHNQVRRMVGALIATATGKITKKDVYEMLTIPAKNSWNPRVNVVPPFGLYLCKVHYDPKDLQFPCDESSIESTLNNC